MQIIDGYVGVPNIYADVIGEHNISMYGSGDYVLNVGECLGYELISNNEIRIKDGMFITQGRRGYIKKGTTEVCRIDNGAQSGKRNDLIVIEYAKDLSTQVESHTIRVLKGIPGAEASDPEITTGNIPDGAILHQMPLYRVRIERLSVAAVEQMFEMGSVAAETVNPMLATEEGFAADAYQTKLQLESCFQSVSNGKILVASAITDQGITTASDATLETMARNVRSIQNAELYRSSVLDAMANTNQGLTEDSTWDDICKVLNSLFPAQLNLLSHLNSKWTFSNAGVTSRNPLSFDADGTGSATATSASFDITTYKSLSVTAAHKRSEGQGGGADCTYNAYLHLDKANKNISLNSSTTIDLSSYTGTAYIYAQCMRAKQYRPDGTSYTASSSIYFSRLMLIAT